MVKWNKNCLYVINQGKGAETLRWNGFVQLCSLTYKFKARMGGLEKFDGGVKQDTNSGGEPG